MESTRAGGMNPEPRQRDDYSERQIEAARRVLVDVGQALAAFADCMVVVGGWIPDLVLPEAEEPHMGSIDVDLSLQADGCGVAFHAPVDLRLPGRNLRGARNTVRLRVASLSDFLVMKAHAIGGRDKPKDTYDLCYCLEHFPGGLKKPAADWQKRLA